MSVKLNKPTFKVSTSVSSNTTPCTEYLEPIHLLLSNNNNNNNNNNGGAYCNGSITSRNTTPKTTSNHELVSEKHLNKLLNSLNETRQGLKSLLTNNNPTSTAHSYLSKFSSTLRLIRHKSSSNHVQPSEDLPTSTRSNRHRSPSPMPYGNQKIVNKSPMMTTGGGSVLVNTSRRHTHASIVMIPNDNANKHYHLHHHHHYNNTNNNNNATTEISGPTLISQTFGDLDKQNLIEIYGKNSSVATAVIDSESDDDDSSFNENSVGFSSTDYKRIDHHSLTIMPNTIITNVYEENGI
jgi:hypothetical protein